VQDLAKLLGIDPGTLAATVLDAQRSARGELADAFGRRDFGLGPLDQRLYGCRVVPGLFHTQGGLAVDLDGRVLDSKARPIPNLFAGGGAAGGLSGRSGAAGYASGNGLLSAIALGRLAGVAAAAEVRGGNP
jgi:predicted oxidoreductase